MEKNWKYFVVPILLLTLIAAAVLWGLCCGTFTLPPEKLYSLFVSETDSMEYRIVVELRLPRVLLALAVGASLAVSGTILQAVMRNPLASPGIIGVSAGGGLAGVVMLLMLPQYPLLRTPAAFAGALAAAGGVYLLAWKNGATPLRLILSGVAVSSLLGAWSSAVLLLHADKAGNVLDFAVGSFAGASWNTLSGIWYFPAVGLLLSFFCGARLNVLMLGDDTATSLGLSVERVRLSMLTLASLLAGAAVSAVGLLGFVGLIAPHIVRIAVGSDHRRLLPCSALFGALLVLLCDTAGRVLRSPEELPVGIIMALLGAPFFLWLLRRSRYEA